MEWYQILSYFLTNGIRGFAGLYLVCTLLLGRKDVPMMGALSAGTAAVITALLVCPVSDAGVLGAEILLLAVGARMLVPRDQIRISLFILFFYEIAAALWEFIISCVFAIAFRVGYLARQCVSHQAMDAFWPCLTGQESAGVPGGYAEYLTGQGGFLLPEDQLWLRFLDTGAPEHLLAVWTVRLFMLVFLALHLAGNRTSERSASRRCRGREMRGSVGGDVFRGASVMAVAGMICVVTLGSQTVISLPEEELGMWNLFSVILMFSVLIFQLNRHYEAEKEIARLKAEQAELLDRDYQCLNRLYSEHARLFHDLHNHMELLHRHLTRGNVDDAVQYLEDLRGPVREITRAVWTGDEAVDYLIGNKAAAAEEQQIAAEVSMEFPRHTNIRSADLTAILGNLLDNALEAAKQAEGNLRFIRLTVRRINDMLVIKVENGCNTAPVSKDGQLLTTKTDGGLHGWGLKSVRAAAEKYEGTVESGYVENVFRVVVTLSFEAVNTGQMKE